ncbi:MAG: hypothetical protein WCL51_06265 [Bacteroidota bacterium]
MSVIYTANYNLIEFEKRINSIIEIKSKNNLLKHLKIIFTIRFNTQLLNKLFGFLKKDKFTIWYIENFYNMDVTSVFYPIIHGKIISSNIVTEIKLKARMNWIGGSLTFIITGLMTYVIVSGFITHSDDTIKLIIIRALKAILAIIIMLFVPLLIYFRNLKEFKAYLIKELELTKVK